MSYYIVKQYFLVWMHLICSYMCSVGWKYNRIMLFFTLSFQKQEVMTMERLYTSKTKALDILQCFLFTPRIMSVPSSDFAVKGSVGPQIDLLLSSNSARADQRVSISSCMASARLRSPALVRRLLGSEQILSLSHLWTVSKFTNINGKVIHCQRSRITGAFCSRESFR